MLDNRTTVCHDARACFARREDGNCIILWDTGSFVNNNCPFAKEVRLITRNVVYPWDGHPAEVRKAYKIVAENKHKKGAEFDDRFSRKGPNQSENDPDNQGGC